MKHFFQALRFLTVFPLGKDEDLTADDLAASTIYYPIVGVLLGLVLFVCWQWGRTTWPIFLASALTVALWAGLTAGLHLDGLMDTFDGLGVRGDMERRLAAMRDSQVGAFGVQSAVFMIFLKIAAVSALAANPAHFPALILAPLAGRTAMVALMSTCSYARAGEGLGRVFVEGTGRWHLAAAVLFFLFLGLLVVGSAIFLVFLWQAVMLFLLRRFFLNNFGGATGDLLGAACEMHELSVLILVPLILL
ncbi:MAG: adenosylcobinamide-GDP ribazoletransferase [Dethiobacter sp.]|jgi:adenosylcobinamide-GDP ribazoletransferase|nr:adenosylcobinamide-GDP ribazoletransferase [Dethiobacter sp.]MBS3900354.1 adenosylcobinamide-GDP ribazoletransferase [Dethiobacter sp.]MBS3983189.1 adenosylcobinamide-GDP ribazoletransferase [Dethiobacter sp.]MCL4462609.1 adenosylcobinamide-GDP ribazoletransferase [Bacillota bacterium]MCL5994003.1 adenosylcobinamide-GDP ribazoletransferase [Bacillota bacterium]